MDSAGITAEEYLEAAREFVRISDKIHDGWTLREDKIDISQTYIKKETFIEENHEGIPVLLKTEYVIFYNLSYGVPSLSFNVWNSSGVLLALEEIRQMAFINISKEDFYSVITQQEHPVLHRPFFIMHPCHTSTLLSTFKSITKNIIVTFLGLFIPLFPPLKLPLEYGL